MKNVSEIINQGNKNAELPAWLNMRHAWSASDAKRDEGLAYPDNVIQIRRIWTIKKSRIIRSGVRQLNY